MTPQMKPQPDIQQKPQSEPKPLRIAHVITSLEVGGAQMMLVKLIQNGDRAEAEHAVFALSGAGSGGGGIAPLLDRLNAPRETLGMRAAAPDPRAFWTLIRMLRKYRPDIVQTWMPHADLMGGAAAKLAGCKRVVWNIRQSSVLPSELPKRTMAVLRICAALSDRLPTRIVSCSVEAAKAHERIGYPGGKIEAIPNGFDTERFRPNEEARQALRNELGIPADAPTVGIVCRYHEKKDVGAFLNAAGQLLQAQPDARFILCGEDMDSRNRPLNDAAERAGVSDRCSLLGRRGDAENVYPAFDLAALTSAYGEGFPNVVGEAMACGVPCAVTDAGESRHVVGGAGFVSPPRDPNAMAQNWIRYFALDGEARRSLSKKARRRIEREYEIGDVARRYLQLYRRLYQETALRDEE